MSSEDREQREEQRSTDDPESTAPRRGDEPGLRPDPEWRRGRPASPAERHEIGWRDDARSSGGSPLPPPPPGAPPGQGQKGGERPARSWAPPRIAAPPAVAPPEQADEPLPLQVDEPVGEAPTAAAPATASATASEPPAPRPAATIPELAQQTSAIQAQVSSLSAQLTTLTSRLTYDLERGAQTTSERILRDLDRLPDQISFRVGAHLGPALDDLTDQVEADGARVRQVLDGDLAGRLRALADTVDALPLGNVEVLNGLQAIGGDLEDRLTRFATRIADQVSALETGVSKEIAKLDTRLDELQQSAGARLDQAALNRMAGQVERLVEQPSVATEVVDAVELLVGEHLEALREVIEKQAAELPAALGEHLDALEVELTARVGELASEQAEALESLAERQAHVLDTTAGVDEGLSERLDELSAAVAALSDRLEEIAAGLPEADGLGTATAIFDEAGLDAIRDELKALRRRITVRLEGSDEAVGLPPEQLEELATQIAHLLA